MNNGLEDLFSAPEMAALRRAQRESVRSFFVSQLFAVYALFPSMSPDETRALLRTIVEDEQLWESLPHALRNLVALIPDFVSSVEADVALATPHPQSKGGRA